MNAAATGRLHDLLSRLRDVEKKGDRQWQARCPAHEDQRASLSIGQGDDGRLLIKCHAGCNTADVLAAIGMKMSDLMPPRESANGKATKKGKIVKTYDYRDEDGRLLSQVCRFEPKDFRQRQPKEGGGWNWSVKGIRVVPYRLPDLLKRNDLVVYICEGEKDVDRLYSIPGWDVTATTNSGGAGKWRKSHAQYLAGRTVAILPDNDQPGHQHAEQVAQSLLGIAKSIKIVPLPGLPEKGDVSDWLDNGGTMEELAKLREAQSEWKPSAEKSKSTKASSGEEKEHKSQATTLVELALQNCDLFHDSDGEAYARFPVVGEAMHWEVSRISAKSFRRWLKRCFFVLTGKAPSAQALQDALGVVEGKAVYDGDCRRVSVRIAEHENRIYLDLANDLWQAVEIDQAGWRIVDDPPVMFRRAKAMQALPTPDPQGDIQSFRRFVNLADEDWPLLLAVLVAALKPTGPYPVLAVYGEHGSAKSTLCRYIRRIVDPNTSPLRADYREPRDLMICANNGWFIALDNLSRIQDWLSDCLCRLSTGGGFSTRTLFQDDEETIFDAKRPVLLNCIDEVVTRSDLLDRCVILNLPRIDTQKRIPEATLDRQFNAALPSILGGLLTAVSTALRNESGISLSSLPRMADFAIWATAAEPALGLKDGEFMQAYTANRAAGNETAIEAAPIGRVLIDFVTNAGHWRGTSAELLQELNGRVDEKARKLDGWPKTPRGLRAALTRLAPNLRETGIGVEFPPRISKSRRITLIRTGEETTVTTVTPSSGAENPDVFESDSMTVDDGHGSGGETVTPTVIQEYPENPEENGSSDGYDGHDGSIPVRSKASEWCEV
jgi:hypothetical protein